MAWSNQPASGDERILSVDALRGFDMFWITGGKEIVLAVAAWAAAPLPKEFVRQFEHVPWEGFVAWDLIMPLFLFIVGTSIPLSFKKRIDHGQTREGLYWKTLKRVLILFVLGMMAQGNLLDFDLDTLHLYCNTLQSIAIGYLVASVVVLHCRLSGHFVVIAALLLGFWALMTLVPVPGQAVGILEPRANLALYVDDQVLGRFSDGTPYTWVLSSMGFAASVLLGVVAGHLLQSDRSKGMKWLLLLAAGAICLGLGWVWGLAFPMIKHLWTSSMVLWAAGWSYLLLALFYGVIDILGLRRWSLFFVVLGANAIVVYMAPRIFDFERIGGELAGGFLRMAGYPGPQYNHLAGILFLWALMAFLYRKKVFIRI